MQISGPLSTVFISSISVNPLVNPNPFPQNYEVVRQAELTLQSILLGSEGVNVTPSPVRNAKHESKSVKAKLDCTYSTGTKGLNVLKMALSARFLSRSTNLSIR